MPLQKTSQHELMGEIYDLLHGYKTSETTIQKTVIRSKLTHLLGARLTKALKSEARAGTRTKQVVTSEKAIQCHLDTPSAVDKCDRGVQCCPDDTTALSYGCGAIITSCPGVTRTKSEAKRTPRRPEWDDSTHVDTIHRAHRGKKSRLTLASKGSPRNTKEVKRRQLRSANSPSSRPGANKKQIKIKSKAFELLSLHHNHPFVTTQHRRHGRRPEILKKEGLQDQDKTGSSSSKKISQTQGQPFTTSTENNIEAASHHALPSEGDLEELCDSMLTLELKEAFSVVADLTTQTHIEDPSTKLHIANTAPSHSWHLSPS